MGPPGYATTKNVSGAPNRGPGQCSVPRSTRSGRGSHRNSCTIPLILPCTDLEPPVSNRSQSAQRTNWNAAPKDLQSHGRRCTRVGPMREKAVNDLRTSSGDAPGRQSARKGWTSGGVLQGAEPLGPTSLGTFLLGARKYLPRKGSGEHPQKQLHRNKKVQTPSNFYFTSRN